MIAAAEIRQDAAGQISVGFQDALLAAAVNQVAILTVTRRNADWLAGIAVLADRPVDPVLNAPETGLGQIVMEMGMP